MARREPVETHDEGDGWTIEIHQDDETRDLDEVIPEGVHVQTWHRRMRLGETIAKPDDTEELAALEDAITAEHPDALVCALYMYDHGGYTFALRPFSCRWDSGQVGVIWTDSADFPDKRAALESVVSEMAAIAEGRVYGYIVRSPEGEHVDSCWGFIGADPSEPGWMLDEARAVLASEREGRKAAERMERESFAL